MCFKIRFKKERNRTNGETDFERPCIVFIISLPNSTDESRLSEVGVVVTFLKPMERPYPIIAIRDNMI